jgi:hypothetical protein
MTAGCLTGQGLSRLSIATAPTQGVGLSERGYLIEGRQPSGGPYRPCTRTA